MTMRVLGKSDPPVDLRDHLCGVRDAARVLLTPARRAAFRRVGVSAEQAADLLLSAIWLHDFGKATREWQNALVRGVSTPQHALTGFLAALWALGARKVEETPVEYLAVALAVLAHHGQLSKSSFQRETFHGQQVSILSETWAELARELPVQVPRKSLPDRSLSADMICGHVEAAKMRCPDLAREQPFRGLYCLLLSLVVESDHAASGGKLPAPQAVGIPRVPGTTTAFQEEVRQSPEEVLCAIAGCGSGKTAAALLRAAECAARNHLDRIVLCLPTRFTSNSLLRDMSDPEKYAYPVGQVGLVHAEALHILRSLTSQEDEQDFTDSPEERASRAVRYEHPVTISTVDHLLMSLYHGYRYSDRAFGNLMSALVVFDEVHAYDTTTLNAIREGLQVLQRHYIPTLFMSATLPSSRRRFFGLGDERTVIEQNNLFHPFRVVKVEEPLTNGRGVDVEATETARSLLREARSLKLAVYVNQVERAKALARAAKEEIPDTLVYCYHSELAPRDRVRLEGKIIRAFKNWRNMPVVLVATQAAELSLDISAERMITEQAPADILVQRAGRLHRRGLMPNQADANGRLPAKFVYELLIAPLDLRQDDDTLPPAALPYKDIALLQRTWDRAPWDEVFDFEQGLRWCEESLTEELPQRANGLLDASIKDAVFGNKPQENFGEDGAEGVVTIRDRDEDTMPAVPEIYFARLPETLDGLARYQVPLRRRKFFALKGTGLIEQRAKTIVLARGTKHQKTIDAYPVWVVRSNLPYDVRRGGFDFRLSMEELSPQSVNGSIF
jgi:CRISPR-associated helicase Cas3/CRISPR-associated endonuclease Cas3-HD